MGELSNMLPFVAMLAVFYFLIIAPQMKRSKREKKFAKALKKGDKVITKSGMHGKIVELGEKDNTCVIETQAGKIKFERSSISMELSKSLNTSPKK